MKSIQEPKTLIRSGVQKSTECGMVVNAKAFEMLARQYSDPIKAILQEISANAADSHIRAGIPKRPFDVKLPNALDPHFRVRDYGVSMSRETIYSVYINYMRSDKTGSNNETGFFGIGSKTPLAYTDSFNIKTYVDGKMNLYTLGYNENGIPELNEFAEYDTDEENGVEISFAVKQEDFSKFATKATHVYSFFDVPPTVVGVTSFETKTFTKVLKGSNWFMFKESMNENSYVVMGNIAYPIYHNDLNVPYSSDYYHLMSSQIVLHVPIGSVSMTPSRESLEYTEATIEYIKSQLDIVKEEMAASVKAEIDASVNKWQAQLKCQELANTLEWRCSKLVDLRHWRGQEIPRKIDLSVNRVYYLDNGKARCRKEHVSQHIPVNQRTIIVIKDTKTKFDSRSRYLCSEQHKTIYLIDNSLPNLKYTEQELRTKLDCDDANIIFYTSQLPDPPRNPNHNYSNGGKRKSTTSAMKFDLIGHSRVSRKFDSNHWSLSEVDLKDTANTYVYVHWYDYECRSENFKYNVLEICELLTKLDIEFPQNFYGIKRPQQNKVNKCPHWITFHAWLQATIRDHYDNEEFRQKIVLNQSLDHVDLAEEINQVVQCQTVPFIDESSDFVKFVKFIRKYGNKHRTSDDQDIDFKSIRDLALYGNYDLKLQSIQGHDKGKEMYDKVTQKYPLVVLFLQRYYSNMIRNNADSIVCTVNAIDAYLK